MGKLSRMKLVFATFAVLMAVCGGDSSVFAQQAPAPGGTGTLSGYITGISSAAARVSPYLQNEVVSRLMVWTQWLSISLASFVMMTSFMRLWRETEASGVALIFFFVRIGVFIVLVGSIISLVQGGHVVGTWIARGSEPNLTQGSILFDFYQAQRESFNESYQKLVHGCFTVRVNGSDLTINPNTAELGTFLGVLQDSPSTIKDINNKLTDSTWTLTTLFSGLSVVRSILEFGDLWCIGLAFVLLVAGQIVGPFAMAMGVDKQFAHKVTYPYLWGMGVLTLVWPSVRYFLMGFAYFLGNVMLAIGDIEPLYAWDDATLGAIRNSLGQPTYVIAFAAFLMLIISGCVWVSPIIAYRFSMGQVYEGMASMASQVGGSIIGTGVEAYSAALAAGINQQAANTQIQGQYSASTGEAKVNREAGMLRNHSQYVSGTAGALSSAQASAGAAMAQGRAGMAQAYQMFGSARKNLPGYNERLSDAARDRTIADTDTQVAKNTASAQLTNREGQAGREAHTQNIKTDRDQQYISGAPVAGQMGGASLAAMEAGSFRLQTNEELSQRMDKLTAMRVKVETDTGQRSSATAGEFADRTADINRGAGDTMAGISMHQAREAAGSAYGASSTAIKGHAQAMNLNNRATNQEFQGRIEAAQMTGEAARAAAAMQAAAARISAVGSKIAHDIQQNMELHF